MEWIIKLLLFVTYVHSICDDVSMKNCNCQDLKITCLNGIVKNVASVGENNENVYNLTIHNYEDENHLAVLFYDLRIKKLRITKSEKLRILSSSSFSVTYIAKENYLSYITVLEVTENENLTKISKMILTLIENVVYIDFSRNSITNLRHGSFIKLEKLEVIDLSRNMLRSISKYSIIGTPRLRYLDLSDNSILSIEFSAISAPYPRGQLTLKLSGNQLHCDCGLYWLADKALRIEGAGNTYCFKPDNYNGEVLSCALDRRDLDLPNDYKRKYICNEVEKLKPCAMDNFTLESLNQQYTKSNSLSKKAQRYLTILGVLLIVCLEFGCYMYRSYKNINRRPKPKSTAKDTYLRPADAEFMEQLSLDWNLEKNELNKSNIESIFPEEEFSATDSVSLLLKLMFGLYSGQSNNSAQASTKD